MKLSADSIRVFVTDLERATSFYRDRLDLRLTGNGTGFAVFETGKMSLIIEPMAPSDPESKELVGRFVGLSFQVDDIEKTVDELRARGVEFDGPPKKQQWGGTLAHFYDPDRNVLTLVSREA